VFDMIQLTVFTGASDNLAGACGQAAELYNTGQFKGSDGLIDPTDIRYQGGGVHMGRDGQWYEDQLKIPGSFLIVATRDGQQVGHSLFFTGEFPSFAADLEWMRSQPGVNKLAFGYLTIVSSDHRGEQADGRISQMLFDERLEILEAEGVSVLGTEVFALPQPNMSSLLFHFRNGAVCVGGVGTHEIPAHVGSGTVQYAQFARAIRGRIKPTGNRSFSVVDGQ